MIPPDSKNPSDKIMERLNKALPSSEVVPDLPLGEMTTYRVGGEAEIGLCLNSAKDFYSFIELAPSLEVPILIYGAASNLLVSDAGFNGLAVRMGAAFNYVEIAETKVTVGSAAALPVVARMTARAGLTGFEWAVGVPGSVGGAVRMNAGGHGSDMKSCLQSVEIGDLKTGKVLTQSPKELQLGYRASAVSSWQIVNSAILGLSKASAKKAEREIAEIVKWRRQNQPGGQNAGSVFKNPPDKSAGEILDLAGAKGLTSGSASVSDKHANFIQVDRGGKSQDVYNLMKKMQELARNYCGVELEPETIMINF